MIKLFRSIIFLGIFSSLHGQLSRSDLNGTWQNDENGWWISIYVDNDHVALFKCYDGKTLWSTRHYWKGNTLFANISYSPNQLDSNNTVSYRFDLTDNKRMIVRILDLKKFGKVNYTKVSELFKQDTECHLE